LKKVRGSQFVTWKTSRVHGAIAKVRKRRGHMKIRKSRGGERKAYEGKKKKQNEGKTLETRCVHPRREGKRPVLPSSSRSENRLTNRVTHCWNSKPHGEGFDSSPVFRGKNKESRTLKKKRAKETRRFSSTRAIAVNHPVQSRRP